MKIICILEEMIFQAFWVGMIIIVVLKNSPLIERLLKLNIFRWQPWFQNSALQFLSNSEKKKEKKISFNFCLKNLLKSIVMN